MELKVSHRWTHDQVVGAAADVDGALGDVACCWISVKKNQYEMFNRERERKSPVPVSDLILS